MLGSEPASTLVLGVVLLSAYRQAWRQRYTLSFLWPGSYRALQSMADVLITGGPETITPCDVADNVEAYVREITAQRRWVYRLALYGMQLASLASRGVPLSELEPGDRRAFLERELPQIATLAADGEEHAEGGHPGRPAALLRRLLQRPEDGRLRGLPALQGAQCPTRTSCASRSS